MPRRPAPCSAFAIERRTLGNGLRVVLAPDRSAGSVAVAVAYDIGFRSEPEGRTGFAHLFEHLMFQGSASLGKMDHARLVQANGGNFNGNTSTDVTRYFEAMPPNALEVALFLEGDRMRACALTPENLRNQIDVVKEEIRVNVLNQPFGGFPWIHLPPVAYDTYQNAHNGYGSFVDLESATLDDAADFFERYYAPSNAVLSIVGDFVLPDAEAMIDRHFGAIEARAVTPLPDLHEPVRETVRRVEHPDPLAPIPALALGWRVPDPIGDFESYLPVVVLSDILGGGEAGRLHRSLVRARRLLVGVSCYIGLFGDPFEARHPTLFQVVGHLNPGVAEDAVATAVAGEVDRLIVDLDDAEVERVTRAMASSYLESTDSIVARALAMSSWEQLHGRPDLVNDIAALLAKVTAADVRASAADWLKADRRSVLAWVPAP